MNEAPSPAALLPRSPPGARPGTPSPPGQRAEPLAHLPPLRRAQPGPARSAPAPEEESNGRAGKEAGGRDGAMEHRPQGPGSLSRHERGRGGCWHRQAAAAGVHGPAGAGGGGAPGREWGWGCGGAPPGVGEPGEGEPQALP